MIGYKIKPGAKCIHIGQVENADVSKISDISDCFSNFYKANFSLDFYLQSNTETWITKKSEFFKHPTFPFLP